MTLAADEFMRRFLLHVLPNGFHRIRHFGLFANNGRKEKLAVARELLGVSPLAGATEASPGDAEAEVKEVRPNLVCAHCSAHMHVVESFVRCQTIRAPPLARGPP